MKETIPNFSDQKREEIPDLVILYKENQWDVKLI